VNARRTSSLLWGVVGALTFLVLVQGYRLVLGTLGISPLAIGAVALCVGVSAAALTNALATWVAQNGRS
jgi:hypothetical protein